MDPAAGRCYAAVAGDCNPIHLRDWSARLPGAPAGMHGMATLAGLALAPGDRYTVLHDGKPVVDGRYALAAEVGGGGRI